MRPPLGELANAEIARSISPGSRKLTGVSSTPSVGATDWIAPNCPIPAAMAGSRRTATRVTLGAISLRSSSRFTPMPYSNKTKPVALPPGRAKLSTNPAPTGSTECANTIGTVRVAPCNAATVGLAVARMTSGASATNTIANLRSSAASPGSPANINPHVSTFGPTQFLKALPERCNASLAFRVFGSRTHEYTDPRNLLALLCPHRNWPYGRRAAEKCDELSPSHGRPRGSGRTIVTVKTGTLEGAIDVRFGS